MEENFPRGALKSTGKKKKQKHVDIEEGESGGEVLFKNVPETHPEEMSKSKKKKEKEKARKRRRMEEEEEAASKEGDGEMSKKKKKKGSDKTVKETSTEAGEEKEDLFFAQTFKPEALSIKNISEDMLVLGAVSEVRDLEMIVNLPGGIVGQVKITDINNQYTNLLQSVGGDDTSIDEDVPGLSSLFSKGDLISCKVKSVSTLSKGRSSIQLSVNPSDVNKDIAASMLRKNMVLSGCIKTKEDHGYTVDLGIKGTVAFLMRKNARAFLQKNKGGQSLCVGFPIRCLITEVKSSGRSVNLTVDPDVLSQSIAESDSYITMATLLPGTKVMTQIQQKSRALLETSFLKVYKGCVDVLHLDETEDTLDMYQKSQKHESVIIYQNPTTKTFGLSLRKAHFGRNILEEEAAFAVAQEFEVGNILEQAKILRLDPNKGALCEVSKTASGYAYVSQLSDDKNVTLSSLTLGSHRRCRIRSFDMFDLVASLTMKESVLKKTFLSYKDITPGAIVKGKIISVIDMGLDVELQTNMRGFVPKTQVADIPIKNIKDMFHEGVTIDLRILTVIPEKKRIILTHKKTLLQSSFPIITSYSHAQLGMVTHGYVAAIKDFGCIVAFYNNIKGLLHRSELSSNPNIIPEENFYIGQVVKVKVISVAPEEEKIGLSIRQLKKKKTAGPSAGFKFGKIVKAKVVRSIKEGLEVITVPDKINAFIPMVHLSDDPSLAPLVKMSYKPGDTIQEVMFWSYVDETNRVIVSCKPSFLREVSKAGYLVHTFSDLQPGLVALGYIRRIMPYGAFVELPNNIVGLCPKGVLSDDFIVNSSDPFDQGQTIRLKVTEVDEEKKRFLVSMKSSDCIEEISSEDGLDVMEDYFAAVDRLRTVKASEKGMESLLSLKVGTVMEGIVTTASSDQVLVQLDKGARGIVDSIHYAGGTPEVGSRVKGCVLDVDLINNVGVLSLREDVTELRKMKKTKNQDQKSTSKFDEAKVLHTTPFFILALKEDGGFVYLPTRKHLNDHDFRTSQLRCRVGDSVRVSLKRVLNRRSFATPIQKDRPGQKSAPEILPWGDHQESGWSAEANKGLSKDEMRSKVQKRLEIVSQSMDIAVGQKVEVVVKIIKPMFLCVETKNGTPGQLHISEIMDEPVVGESPLSKYNGGESLTARIIGFRLIKEQNFVPITHPNFTRVAVQLTARASKLKEDYHIPASEPSMLSQLSKYTPGQSVIGFVKNYSQNNLVVSLGPNHLGWIHQLDISKSLQVLEKPPQYFKTGQAIKAQVILVNKEQHKLELTMTGSTTTELEPGMVVNGRVAQVRKDSLYMQLPRGHHGFVFLTDIRDHFIDEPLKGFSINQFCRCAIIDVPSKERVVLSLRPSRVSRHKDPGMDAEVTTMKDVKEGDLLRGYVKRATDKGIFISLSRSVVGRVMLKRVSAYYIKEPLIFFPEGKLVTVKVIKVKREKGEETIELSCSGKDTGLEEIIPQENRGSKRQKISNRKKKTSKGSEELDSGVGEVEALSDSDVEIISKPQEDTTEVPRLHLQSGFTLDSKEEQPSTSKSSKREADSDSDDEDEQEKERKVEEPPKKKSRKEKAEAEKAEEDMLFKMEQALMDSERAPETLDDFDRLVISSPNSSIVWIRYMAFHLQLAEVEKARAVVERALKTISFREEQEKLNMWVAYMNLENMHGTEETLLKVFERALQNCEPIKVFQQLINIYIRTEKLEDAEQLYETKVKRFKQNKAVWIEFGTFLMKNGNHDSARNQMQRSFKSLAQKDHVDIISKFAQLEYKHGEPERGQTMFENVLSNYPRRTDVWSVYLDMMIKHGDLESTRRLFERVITLNLSPKKIKFFFKRYLDFEKEHGTDESVDAVKGKVLEYVESKPGSDEDR